jgi:Fe-S-cluster containining protein
VTEQEIGAIANHLDIEEDIFIQQYTRLRPDRGGLALIDREDGACFFLKGNECSIQSVKPQQCKDFPNAWNFPGWRDICEAIEVPARDEA